MSPLPRRTVVTLRAEMGWRSPRTPELESLTVETPPRLEAAAALLPALEIEFNRVYAALRRPRSPATPSVAP